MALIKLPIVIICIFYVPLAIYFRSMTSVRFIRGFLLETVKYVLRNYRMISNCFTNVYCALIWKRVHMYGFIAYGKSVTRIAKPTHARIIATTKTVRTWI